jgi:hypothetical protein
MFVDFILNLWIWNQDKTSKLNLIILFLCQKTLSLQPFFEGVYVFETLHNAHNALIIIKFLIKT